MSNNKFVWLVSSYLILGALHEVSHIATARVLGYSDAEQVGVLDCFGALLGRTVILPSLEAASEFEVDMVRHAGWIVSLLLWLLIWSWNKYYDCTNGGSKYLQTAALVTLVEALSTDLLGLSSGFSHSRTMFACGNFGVIMLHDAWVKTPGDNGKTVLDLLEKMIQITMMRGGKQRRYCRLSSLEIEH